MTTDAIKAQAAAESSRAVVQGFFNGFMTGYLQAVFDSCAPDVEYTVNTRDTVTREAIPWSTTFHGVAEVQAFFGRLMENFDVLGFEVSAVLVEGHEAAAFGHFKYRAKPTGLDCETDWCARFAIRDGRIAKYQFFEDSYAIARAFRRSGHWVLAVDHRTQTVPAG